MIRCLYCTTVQLRDALDNCETEARMPAPFAMTATLKEAFEDMRHIVRRDAGA